MSLRCTTLVLVIGLNIPMFFAAATPLWHRSDAIECPTPCLLPQRFAGFEADPADLYQRLSEAPHESDTAAWLLFPIPMPDGSLSDFLVARTDVMHPDLGSRYPQIKTFLGNGITDPYAYLRMDITEFGFHAMVLSPRGAVIVEPVVLQRQPRQYISFYRRDMLRPRDFQCLVGHPVQEIEETPYLAKEIGKELRTYRLALACTGEYAAKFGGTISGALSAMVTTINRVTGIYEQELAIRLQLIPNDTVLIFLNPATDPYTNSNTVLMLSQNQKTIDSLIGTANYDIGHVFGTAGGGIASLGVVCSADDKAEGVTSSPTPYGDAFDVDYVAHEMGHQFGANHTFNSTTGSCSGNRWGPTAYEPGSGSTIMSYAGLCGSNNLQNHSDPYFHTGSFDEIINYVTVKDGKNCPVITQLPNNPPQPASGKVYYIPISTPFRLEGSATDPDGHLLTYLWDEIDKGTACDWYDISGNAPAFRSMLYDTVPYRYFPKLATVILNYPMSQKGEVLADYARAYKFRLVVRDHYPGGGGVAYNSTHTTVNVVNGGTPFKVLFPNTNLTWAYNTYWTVLWDVANTTVPPINCQYVNILLSLDGGFTYPITLAAQTPNDGAETVLMPNDPGLVGIKTARIMVQAADNIFYDISDASFTITDNVGLTHPEPSATLQLFPQPAVDVVYGVVGESDDALQEVIVRDLTGGKVLSVPVRWLSPFRFELRFDGLPAGMYLVQTAGRRHVYVSKLIKQ